MVKLVYSFSELADEALAEVGGKGASLARLARAGLPVPDGFVILPGAFEGAGLSAAAWEQVEAHLQRLGYGKERPALAVRSSASQEDSAGASFAGEFESVLNVRGASALRAAIDTVYQSRHSERVQAYSAARGLDAEQPIAVIVQALVRADCSGVLFTANPVTGARDEAMISAAWGLGEAIVGGLVTPDTLLVDKASGRVRERTTAVKERMTVLQPQGTAEEPVPEALREAPVLSDAEAAELVRLGAQIETLYGRPMDIEWARAGGAWAIVQARPVTALPEAPLPPAADWQLPPGATMAMRNNIVELMADPLSPLFATLGLRAVNASMHRILTAFFGRKDMMPPDLIITVNQYAYYNGSLSAGQVARILLSSVSIARRMFRGAVARWTEDGRPRYLAAVARWQEAAWRDMPATDILAAVRALAEAAIDAYGALVSGVIPAAWISEGLFTRFYNLLVRQPGDPEASHFLLGFESLPLRAEKALHDLAAWVRPHASLATYLLDTPAAHLAAAWDRGAAPEGVGNEAWQAWRARFRAHLQAYGHTIYNLDFANPVPADDPAPLLETLKLFVSGEGADPYARQETAAARREAAAARTLARLRGRRLRLFRRLLDTAQRYAPLREDGLADVGLAYPLLRQMLAEVGDRLVQGGAIDQAQDIYWLAEEELARAAAALDEGAPLPELAATIPGRKAAWQGASRLEPPLMLPQIKILGVDVAARKAKRRQARQGDVLKGVAASPGRVTGTAAVLHGPEDFAQMRTGDVLVAPLTTPAWTPLFARAAAIVTDVGGPLSHGSIVAREYGIPAVLGTGVATKRIRSGQTITVDGKGGEVYLGKT